MPSIRKRGKSYELRASCGFDGRGKRIVKYKTFTPSPKMSEKNAEKEAYRLAILFEEQCKNGQVLDNSTRLGDFIERWFKDYAEKQLRPSTIRGYRAMTPRIKAALGNLKLCKIMPFHLLSFYDNLSESGVRGDVYWFPTVDIGEVIERLGVTKTTVYTAMGVQKETLNTLIEGGKVTELTAQKACAALGLKFEDCFQRGEDKGLSGVTIQKYHRLLSVILQTAVQWQMIFSNPCDRVKPPKAKRHEARFLDEHGAAQLAEALHGEPYNFAVIVLLLMYTGLRRGEALGLEWHDVDFEKRCLHIRRSLLYVPDRGVFVDDTKTESSKRVIKVPTVAIDLLREYKQWQDELKAELGDMWVESDRVFTNWKGEPQRPDIVSAWFHKFVQRKGLPDVSIHGLRHTNATLMIAGGVPIKTVSSRLGHANITTTGNIYAHAIRSADEAAAEVLEDIFMPTLKKD